MIRMRYVISMFNNNVGDACVVVVIHLFALCCVALHYVRLSLLFSLHDRNYPRSAVTAS